MPDSCKNFRPVLWSHTAAVLSQLGKEVQQVDVDGSWETAGEWWIPGTIRRWMFTNFLVDSCSYTFFLCLPVGYNPGRMGWHHVLCDGCTFFLQFYIFYIAYNSKYELWDAPIPCPCGVRLFPGLFTEESFSQPGFRVGDFPPAIKHHYAGCD